MTKPGRVVPLLVLLFLLSTMPVAKAGLAAKTNLVTDSAGATKIVLRLTSSAPVTARTKPRTVTVIAGGENYPLDRVRSVATTATKLGTWKSSGFRGASQDALLGMVGGNVTVKVTSRAGRSKFQSKLTGSDITGQAAIDLMSRYINGGAWRDFVDGDRYELHLCTDGWLRYYGEAYYPDVGPIAVEKYGQPWSVTEALIQPNTQYYNALVHVDFTLRNDSGSGVSETDESWLTRVEFYEGQWYWGGDLSELIPSSCDPTF